MTETAVYHHLTPQTYMRAWKYPNSKSSVYVVEKGTNGYGSSKKTENFAGINHYHSFCAGSPALTKADCQIIFAPLQNYVVQYEGLIISDVEKMNQLFYDFDEWTIFNAQQIKVTEAEKENLRAAILDTHIRDIETNWNRQYENNWNNINQAITSAVFTNIGAHSIPAVKREELIKFMVSLEWRTKPYHPELIKSLNIVMSESFLGVDFKSIVIPEPFRLYPFLETVFDEMVHSYILKLYRQFLDGTGPIMKEVNQFNNQLNTVLLVAPNNKEFITSDNPVCRYLNAEGKIEYIFPLNPKIACKMTRGANTTDYMIQHLTENELVTINHHLKDNCDKYYILREQNRALYF